MGGGTTAEDPRGELFTSYLKLYALFGGIGQPDTDLGDPLKHYVASQHCQCVYCSGPFPTDKWMAADVRSDITVQTFSNRFAVEGVNPRNMSVRSVKYNFCLRN